MVFAITPHEPRAAPAGIRALLRWELIAQRGEKCPTSGIACRLGVPGERHYFDECGARSRIVGQDLLVRER